MRCDYCSGLIAQDTLTVTDSVSSPCATGAARHAGGHLAESIGAGAPAFGNAERRAERDAGGLGVDLGLAAGVGDRLFAGLVEQFRGLRHHEIDAADLVGAGAHQRVDHAGDLGDVAQPDRHAIAGAVADDGGAGRCGSARHLRLQRQPRGLDILLVDAGALQRQQHLAHRRVVGVGRLARGLGLRGDAAVDLRQIGRHRDGGLAGDGNHRRAARSAPARARRAAQPRSMAAANAA